MNCKNCNLELNQKDDFCRECGAKIIRKRITVKNLFANLLAALGWDNNFFVTLRYLLYKPQIVFKEYINGTRKKYANPFTFFAISLAISLFVFNQYSEQLIELSTNTSLQSEIKENPVSENIKDVKSKEIFGYKNQVAFTKGMLKLQMKYYNLYNFLILPIYTLIAFLVFRKPYNYGEHLIINTYLLGLLTFLGTLLFVFSIGPLILMFIYYSYAYNKLYRFTFGQLLLKILKFIGILLLVFLISIVIVVIVKIIQIEILN